MGDEGLRKFGNNLLENSINLKNKCGDMNAYVQTLVAGIKNLPPKRKRYTYDKMFNTLDEKITDTNSAITYLVTIQNEINKNISETITCYKEVRELLEKSKLIYNTAQVGTLQGLTRDMVDKHNIQPTDNISAAIKEQSYEEPNGGRRKKTRKQRNRSYKRK
jgi:hypothetical protein